jgi:KaiC/GvpD/RAD55 family RecA-like ATPase
MEEVKLEIPGIEELIGGIEKGSIIIISGGAGAGKTIFGMQVLYQAALRGEKGLYISFEEPVENIRRHCEKFGWRISELEEKGNLKLVQAPVEELAKLLKKRLLTDIIMDFDPNMVVVDSLSALEESLGDKPTYRANLSFLIKVLREKKVTALLLTEAEQELREAYSRSGMPEFLADGVIVLYNFKAGVTRVRAIEVLKMRGAKHSRMIVPFEITDKGIVVYPKEQLLT